MAEIVLDARERKLQLELRALECVVEHKTLDLGDILIGDTVIVERKTGPDLAASIKDNRLREQRARLLACGRRVIYIIEGPLSGTSLPCTTLVGAISNMIVRDNIQVLRTVDVADTAAMVVSLAKKVDQFLVPAAAESGLAPPKLLGKRKRNSEHVAERMLMCVPGISGKMAAHICEQYSTIAALREALDTPDCEVAVGPGRRLGKKMIMRVRGLL